MTTKYAVSASLLLLSIASNGNAFFMNSYGTFKRGTSLHMVTTSVNDASLLSRRNLLSTAGTVGAAFMLGGIETFNSFPAYAEDFTIGGKMVLGDESIMSPKEHGTSAKPVQQNLRYESSVKLADKICNFNRHFAEMGGYFQGTSFEDQVLEAKGPITFYDSVTGKPLFVAPVGRSAEAFVQESYSHGWPSFRDQEVVWDNVRVLKNSGETVSLDGTHLGHNLPDKRGNRYCINLVSISGNPTA